MDRRARRPRLELLVTDRAGNTASRSVRVRIPVVDRPILGFLVGPGHDFAMFSRAGDRAVGRLVNELIRGVASGALDSNRELRERSREGADAIADAGHDEVGDTAVGDAIFEALYVPLARRGFDAEAVVSA